MRVSWSLASSDLRSLVKESQTCENEGLHGVWFPDYEAPSANWPELYVTLTYVATATTSLHIGSLVTDVLRRHPMVTAHAFASLSYLAPGRIALGLGAGAGTSHLPFGISVRNSFSKLKEGVDVIRALWKAEAGETVNYSGDYFSLKQAAAPLQPSTKIPIYLAAYGPRMLDLTARAADGWIPEAHTPESFRLILTALRQKMTKVNRKPPDLEACSCLIFYPWRPDEETHRRLLRAAKNYLAEYPDIMWAVGKGKNHPGTRSHNIVTKKQLWQDTAATVPDELAEKTLVYGDIQDCLNRLSEFSKAGCDNVILEPYWIEKTRIGEAIGLAGTIAKGLQ